MEHLIGLPIVSREDKIAALELLGATYVDKKRDMVNALQFWRRSMEERYIDLNCSVYLAFSFLSFILFVAHFYIDIINSQLFQNLNANLFQRMIFLQK